MSARIFLVLLAAMAATMPAAAQTRPPRDTGTPNAMQGFSKNKGQPVQIDADRLEVRDKDKVATFSGKVQVTQGDTTLRSKTLTVYYVGEMDKKSEPQTTVGPAGNQKIKKLEARGDVVVTQNDQIATGEAAVFDMDTNVITMSGGVVLTQGQNVLRGNRLVVDMSTGHSRVESGSGGSGRVQGLFVPSGGQNPTTPGKPGNKPSR